MLFTLGEMAGVSGGTNTLRILEVGSGKAVDAGA